MSKKVGLNQDYMKKQLKYLIVGALMVMLMLSSVGCGNRKHEKGKPGKLEKLNDKVLQSALEQQSKIPFEFMTVRIGVDLKSTARDASFSCYLKLNVDKEFGGSVKVGPVVLASYLINTDSVMFVNKRDDCYFRESIDYVSSLFGTEIEFDFFQELLTGRPIGYDADIKYKQIDAEDHYILSTHKERVFKKLENDRLDPKDDLMLIQYHFNAASLKADQVNVQVPSDTAEIEIRYIEEKITDNVKLPEETTILITSPRDTLFMRLNYGVIKLNEPKVININIPDSYSECR